MGRVIGSWKTAGLVGGSKTLSGRRTGITSSDGVGDVIARREMDRGPLARLAPVARYRGKPMFESAELIHRYTRADALRDGVSIDVSATAREAGFKYPVALTAAAWAKCVAVPPGVLCQAEAGRL
jgi:hypothetical protein